MPYPTKIATCCHCGTRAALTLDRGRHALACNSCGAPLNDLKALPAGKAAAKPAISHQPAVRAFPQATRAEKHRKPRKIKKRKSLFSRFAEEAFDLVEDIFD